MSNTNISRRAIMAGAATAPVFALPAVAIAADNPDAELLRLGEKLAVLERERAAMKAIDRKHSALLYAEIERRTGIARCDAPDYTTEDRGGYWAVHHQVSKELEGPNPDDEDETGATRWDRFNQRECPILPAILESRAATQEGLKLQARASALATDFWDGAAARDSYERLFIESVCAFFGLDAEQIARGEAVQS